MSDRDENPEDDSESDDEFLGRIDLDSDGVYQADVFKQSDAEEGEDYRIDLDTLFDLLGVEPNDQDTLLDLLTQRAGDVGELGFDHNSPNGRGGYDHDEVIKFLQETGWWGLVQIYYDEGYQEYFIELPDNSDSLKA